MALCGTESEINRVSEMAKGVLEVVADGYDEHFEKYDVGDDVVKRAGTKDAYPKLVTRMFKPHKEYPDEIGSWDRTKFRDMLRDKDHTKLAKTLLAMDALNRHDYETMSVHDALEAAGLTEWQCHYLSYPLIAELKQFVSASV